MHRIVIFSLSLIFAMCAPQSKKQSISPENARSALRVSGLEMTRDEVDSLLPDIIEFKNFYDSLRKVPMPNDIPPAFVFRPLYDSHNASAEKSLVEVNPPLDLSPSMINADLAKLSVVQLANLIKTGRLTSMQLTRFFLNRLKKYDKKLHCVVNLTEERALRQAAKADRELKNGKYRGLLHGIPYGIKDLFAVKGYPTTWGAAPFKMQHIDYDASVVKKLDEAGAVLVAKLSSGALAWGDVWYGGKTRNPWDVTQGSSGSSAGPAAAVSAGLVPFAIGTETWGSIVSPSTRCGVTGLRPTFGRVSRYGAMALSWTMDKAGPIARSAEDCAVVFNAIRGSDGMDLAVHTGSFSYSSREFHHGMVIGYFQDAMSDTLYAGIVRKFKEAGYHFKPVLLPNLPIKPLSFILSAEAAAAFDDLTRSNKDDELVRQVRNAWPNVFRAARFIPAVEYIQANRIRSLLMAQMEQMPVDAWLSPPFYKSHLLLTNLTGHPSVVFPVGFDSTGHPQSMTLTGQLYKDDVLLELVNNFQQHNPINKKFPPLFFSED